MTQRDLDRCSRATCTIRSSGTRCRPTWTVLALMLGPMFGWLLGGCSLFDGRHDVLILARANDPISLAIARSYAETREISERFILALPIPADKTREIDLDTYQRTIAEPLEAHLAAHDPDHEITTLVTTLGLPLRIGHCPATSGVFPRDCSAAALDAALAGLGRIDLTREPGDDAPGLRRAPNPYFGDDRSFEQFRRDEPDATLRFLVARLTGPATPVDADSGVPRAVRTLLTEPVSEDDSEVFRWRVLDATASRSRSAATRALLDPIAIRVDAVPGHSVCDDCADASTLAPAAGVVLSENLSPRSALGNGTRELAAPGLVIDLVGRPPGSGRSDHSDLGEFESRLGEWLEAGARVVSAHLADPSIAGVARPDLQIEALAQGRTMAEAHFRSLPHLGWLNVLVGDPLSRLPAREVDEEELGLAQREADSDHDGIVDSEDNCRHEPNPAQRDSDGDRIGNRCDPDVNNDGQVDTSWGQIYPRDARGDLEAIALTARNGPHNPNHDLDGDGRVDDRDLALAQLWLFRAPGPSGRVGPGVSEAQRD